VSSRELRLARELCEEAGVESWMQSIDERVLDPGLFETGFAASETLVCPHWMWSGRFLRDRGVRRVSAGILGEVLGGHYGLTMVTRGVRRVVALLGSALRNSAREPTLDDSMSSIRELLRVRSVRQWYFAPEFQAELERAGVLDAINADIETDLQRLRRRGIETPSQLLEAFITEHRGGHYINAQLLSVRPFCDVSLPFADRSVLEVTTRIPVRAKVHNVANQALLRRHWPSALRFPMAATLLPASAPMLLQEASRGARKVLEKGWSSLSTATGGSIRRPRLGWVDFEFLRGSSAFARLGEGLTHPIWNRVGIRTEIAAMGRPGNREPAHPMYDQVGKIATMQRWLQDN
jgi:hypothetical protein